MELDKHKTDLLIIENEIKQTEAAYNVAEP